MGSALKQILVCMYRYLSIVVLCFFSRLSFTTTLVIPPDGDIIGEVEYTHPQNGETLAAVGVRYDIGYYQMVNANPHADPTNPLPPQTRLLIPSQFILPQLPREGLIINLAEYRLYFFPENDNIVITHPVGIGRKGWSTPIGKTTVVAKQVNPTWRPTTKLLAESAKNGMQYPDTFPPGPGNPLGKHVFRLGWPTYLIHGTHHMDGVGERVSAGCIRMLPDDIEYLFGFVTVGTVVHVVNNPLKFGWLNGALYIEVHPPLSEQRKIDLQQLAHHQLTQQNVTKTLNQAAINQEINQPTGVPRKIMS
jgi:L,D-transpeptidase ErfK/SrfK